ncbi:HNH endonuclease [Candidatus Peregrinibacteria bacterium]|nr:HNH endonuclease [Candidatus Peregrinibacteria bacterium]
MIDPKILHQKFVELGRQRNKLTNEMLEILPDIFNSGIWKKYFTTIIEYAGKLGGIPKSTVIKRLNLEKHLENKPKLKEAIRKVGIHKVAMVATIATPETDAAFADKIENMSKSAVEILSKELREKMVEKNWRCKESCDQMMIDDHDVQQITVCKAVPKKLTVALDEEMTFLFLKLKNEYGEKLSDREAMGIILRETFDSKFGSNKPRVKNSSPVMSLEKKEKCGEIIDRKNEEQAGSTKNIVMVSRACPEPAEGNHDSEINSDKNSKQDVLWERRRDFCFAKICGMTQSGKMTLSNTVTQSDNPLTRHIPSPKKREELAKTNGCCAYPNCNHPPENWHHRDRFSQSKSHDSVVPLCKNHHEFMHNGLVKNELAEPKNWQIDLGNLVANNVDNLYRKHRQDVLS